MFGHASISTDAVRFVKSSANGALSSCASTGCCFFLDAATNLLYKSFLMEMDIATIEAAALALNAAERLQLLQALAESLEAEEPGAAEAWRSAILGRIAEFDSGQTRARSVDEVIAGLRNETRAAR